MRLKHKEMLFMQLIPKTKLIRKNHETYMLFSVVVGGQRIEELTSFLSARISF